VLAARPRKGQLALPTVPDAFLVVRNHTTGKAYPFLFELDLGTESVAYQGALRADFARKVEGYLDYTTKEFREEFGIDAPPIVLIVADSDRRMASLRATTQRLGGRGRFWFSTLPRLRGMDTSTIHSNAPSTGLQGSFWGSNWFTADKNEVRSLADRCGY
jgi:hypothetical protein